MAKAWICPLRKISSTRTRDQQHQSTKILPPCSLSTPYPWSILPKRSSQIATLQHLIFPLRLGKEERGKPTQKSLDQGFKIQAAVTEHTSPYLSEFHLYIISPTPHFLQLDRRTRQSLILASCLLNIRQGEQHYLRRQVTSWSFPLFLNAFRRSFSLDIGIVKAVEEERNYSRLLWTQLGKLW